MRVFIKLFIISYLTLFGGSLLIVGLWAYIDMDIIVDLMYWAIKPSFFVGLIGVWLNKLPDTTPKDQD